MSKVVIFNRKGKQSRGICYQSSAARGVLRRPGEEMGAKRSEKREKGDKTRRKGGEKGEAEEWGEADGKQGPGGRETEAGEQETEAGEQETEAEQAGNRGRAGGKQRQEGREWWKGERRGGQETGQKREAGWAGKKGRNGQEAAKSENRKRCGKEGLKGRWEQRKREGRAAAKRGCCVAKKEKTERQERGPERAENRGWTDGQRPLSGALRKYSFSGP